MCLGLFHRLLDYAKANSGLNAYYVDSTITRLLVLGKDIFSGHLDESCTQYPMAWVRYELNTAERYLREKDWRAAYDHITRIKEEDASESIYNEYLVLMARVLDALEDDAQIAVLYRKSMRLRSNNGEIRFLKALMHFRKNEYAEASKDFRGVLEEAKRTGGLGIRECQQYVCF